MLQGLKPSFYWLVDVAAEQVAEKVNSKPLLVAQALLPVLVLLHLSSMHSQEWLCYSTFSATCEAATHNA
jgi:Flp pilus assembly protein CpaB